MNITYLLDFLPTYVAREITALAEKDISISIHLLDGYTFSQLSYLHSGGESRVDQ